jgi:hypothetical protein
MGGRAGRQEEVNQKALKVLITAAVKARRR